MSWSHAVIAPRQRTGAKAAEQALLYLPGYCEEADTPEKQARRRSDAGLPRLEDEGALQKPLK
jgi:hypothetical protein